MLLLGRIVAALFSGALLAQAYGLTPFWPLAWIAPIPLLIAAIGASRSGSFLYGALAGAVSNALMFAYLMELAGPVVPLMVTLMKALIWGGAAFATRGAARRLPAWAAVFVFPAIIAGVETLINVSSPHGSAGSLAYSQMDFLPAIQAASIGGAPAIAFVVTLFASAIALVIARRVVLAALIPGAIVVAAIAWGYARVPTVPEPAAPLRLALLAGDDFDTDASDWRPTWEAYLNEVERAATEGAHIIVLPEKIVTLPDGDAGEALAPLSAIAAQHGAIIVVGAVAVEGGSRFNRAYYISREGVRAYDKHHMIPGLESDLTPGGSILFTDAAGTRIGILICKDMDFPALARRYGHNGVGLMIVPAWDFTADAWLHGRMAVLRGIESGFSIARSAREGLMTVSDAYGRVSAESTSGADIAALSASIAAPRPVPTFYVRFGDAFGWVCVVLALALIGWSVFSRNRAE